MGLNRTLLIECSKSNWAKLVKLMYIKALPHIYDYYTLVSAHKYTPCYCFQHPLKQKNTPISELSGFYYILFCHSSSLSRSTIIDTYSILLFWFFFPVGWVHSAFIQFTTKKQTKNMENTTNFTVVNWIWSTTTGMNLD